MKAGRRDDFLGVFGHYMALHCYTLLLRSAKPPTFQLFWSWNHWKRSNEKSALINKSSWFPRQISCEIPPGTVFLLLSSMVQHLLSHPLLHSFFPIKHVIFLVDIIALFSHSHITWLTDVNVSYIPFISPLDTIFRWGMPPQCPIIKRNDGRKT